MIHLTRLPAGPTLRALFLASALGLAAGAAVLVSGPAHAQTATASPAFASDRLSVEVIGQGPDVILIPGYASSREVWRAEAERLAPTHRVHLVQFSGFAGEPWSHGDGPFLQPALDELARYVREQGLTGSAAIGHSMGGLSALMLAQQQPDLFGRVMSVDSLPFFPAMFGPQATVETTRPFADQGAQTILNADEAAFRTSQEQSAQQFSRDPATRAAIVDWAMAGDRHALAAGLRDVMLTDARPGLAAMTTPVWAVYVSDADGGAPQAMADALWAREYAALPGVTLRRIDGSRHFVMADQPARFAEVVDQFLAE